MTEVLLPDSTPLGDARAWLRARVTEGQRCPCCSQFAKVYRRAVTAQMARALIFLYRDSGQQWGHWPTILKTAASGSVNRADEAKLRYWDLVEEETTVRPDGGRAGWWRVTSHGAAFVSGWVTVDRYALVFDSRCLGFTGPQVTIVEALGTTFDLEALMRGEQ